jgi:hypothetical protein
VREDVLDRKLRLCLIDRLTHAQRAVLAALNARIGYDAAGELLVDGEPWI